MNYIYQIVIPLNKNDFKFYNTDIEVLYSPPMFANQEIAETIKISEQPLNMSSVDVIKGEEQIFSLEYDREQYKNLVAYNPVTKKLSEVEYNKTDIVKIVFGNSNIKFPINE